MLLYDDRLGKSHWTSTSHDGDFGFGGHCFPKDLKHHYYILLMNYKLLTTFSDHTRY